MDKEKLIKSIMADCKAQGEPVTREEAEEMAEMELKSHQIKKYEQESVTKVRKVKDRKVDEEKKNLLSCIKVLMEGLGAEKLTLKTETELSFHYNNNTYTIKLTKHRPPK